MTEMYVRKSAIRNPHSAIGLTLVEVMITLAIFVSLAAMTLWMMRALIDSWTTGERHRELYERASGALDHMAEDLSLALSQEPPGVAKAQVKFIGDYDAATGQQTVTFVRTFESGPERALTFFAGDGQPNALRFRTKEQMEDDDAPPPPAGVADADNYTGAKIGDYKALGGMAMIKYGVVDRVLYRQILAPVPDPLPKSLDAKTATPVIEDALYLGFDYWTQYSTGWIEGKTPRDTSGPSKVWDSTRGITALPLNAFILHRGEPTDGLSYNDPSDDVYPQKVRITLTVDSPMPRCTHTKTLDELSTDDGMIFVGSTKGFPAGGTPDSYILIDNEWIHYKEKKDDRFVVDVRGARGTTRAEHDADAVVRVGKTFRRTVYLLGYKDDFVPDEIYMLRRGIATAPPAGQGQRPKP